MKAIIIIFLCIFLSGCASLPGVEYKYYPKEDKIEIKPLDEYKGGNIFVNIWRLFFPVKLPGGAYSCEFKKGSEGKASVDSKQDFKVVDVNLSKQAIGN